MADEKVEIEEKIEKKDNIFKKTGKFFKKAFKDMGDSAKAQHQVDKANFATAKAEAKANFEENRGSNTFKKAKAIIHANEVICCYEADPGVIRAVCRDNKGFVSRVDWLPTRMSQQSALLYTNPEFSQPSLPNPMIALSRYCHLGYLYKRTCLHKALWL